MKKQPRIEERIALVDVKVCLNTDGGRVLNCELLDVSPSGARLKLPLGEKRRKGGEKVTLQVSSLPLGSMLNNKQALVIWTDGEQLGMRLIDPLALPEEDMRGLLKFNIPHES
jgi:hypothetical protein